MLCPSPPNTHTLSLGINSALVTAKKRRLLRDLVVDYARTNERWCAALWCAASTKGLVSLRVTGMWFKLT